MANHLKLSSFYGSNIARPYIVFDPQGAEVSARVDRPRVNDALIGELPVFGQLHGYGMGKDSA